MLHPDSSKLTINPNTGAVTFLRNYKPGYGPIYFSVSCSNTNSLDKASKVAKEILRNDNSNQDAWLVYLTHAKLNNISEPFYELKKQHRIEELSIVKFIFYNAISCLSIDYLRSLYVIIQTKGLLDNVQQGCCCFRSFSVGIYILLSSQKLINRNWRDN